MDLKTINVLVQIENKENKQTELDKHLINSIYSYYANKLTIEQKENLLYYIYINIDNERFIKDLDNFCKPNKNLETLENILHILEINL